MFQMRFIDKTCLSDGVVDQSVRLASGRCGVRIPETTDLIVKTGSVKR